MKLVMSLVMVCCAGCIVEKNVYRSVSRGDGRNKTSVSCAARFVKAFGIDYDCFANTNQFNVKNGQKRSRPAKLEKPFGPFDSIIVSMTDYVPTVINVSKASRSVAANGLRRLWPDEIELSHEYLDDDAAERILADFSSVLCRLNRALGCDLAPPRWPAVIERSGASSRRNKRDKESYLTENGERPKLVATYNLVDQCITLEAVEGLYASRGKDVALLVPPKISMRIKFSVAGSQDCWDGARKYDELILEEIEPVTLGDPISKELLFSKEEGDWCGDLEFNEDPDDRFPGYEYDANKKRLRKLLQ